jgi:ferredoxin-NADP reductase
MFKDYFTRSLKENEHLVEVLHRHWATFVFATQLSGDFVLPKDQNKKLVFVAGGIGITPFRSMLKYLLDTKQKRNIVLFYSNKTQEEIAYKDLLEECAKSFGLKTVFLVTDSPRLAPFVETGSPRLAPLVETGFLDQGKIEKYEPDFKSRVFYLSGPNAMVENYKTMLLKMGVGRGSIVTDYFPGFA